MGEGKMWFYFNYKVILFYWYFALTEEINFFLSEGHKQMSSVYVLVKLINKTDFVAKN